MQIKKVKRYNIGLVRANADCVFIFGDNLLRKGTAGQASIRNEPNAYGVPTKKYPSMTEESFFSDKEYNDNIKEIQLAIDKIPSDATSIIFPSAETRSGPCRGTSDTTRPS